MIWLTIALMALAVVVGEAHGRSVAYRRREHVLAGLVLRLEQAGGRWPGSQAALRVFAAARMPARARVLGPDVRLDEIEETDADRAFVPVAGCCADCDDARDAAGRAVAS